MLLVLSLPCLWASFPIEPDCSFETCNGITDVSADPMGPHCIFPPSSTMNIPVWALRVGVTVTMTLFFMSPMSVFEATHTCTCVCVCVRLCVCVSATCVQVPEVGGRGDIRSPGAGVIGNCGPPMWVLGTRAGPSRWSASTLHC